MVQYKSSSGIIADIKYDQKTRNTHVISDEFQLVFTPDLEENPQGFIIATAGRVCAGNCPPEIARNFVKTAREVAQKLRDPKVATEVLDKIVEWGGHISSGAFFISKDDEFEEDTDA